MAFIADPATVEFLRTRLPRIHHPLRRARVADVLWEYGRNASAARIAIETYEAIGQRGIRSSEEFAPMRGSGALARALSLASALNDTALTSKVIESVLMSIDALAERDEHVALFVLIEALVTRNALGEGAAKADEALRRHNDRLVAADADNFHFQQAILRHRQQLAKQRGDDDAAKRLARDEGEAIVREAAWKGDHYPNGGLVAMHFYEKAAQHFERLGDGARAEELRALERSVGATAMFGRIEIPVRIDASSLMTWVHEFVANQERSEFWAAIGPLLPLPSLADLDSTSQTGRTDAPLLSMIGLSTVEDDEITESVPAEDATRHRARVSAYEPHGALVAVLLRTASQEEGIQITEAVGSIAATGRIDKTSVELTKRVAQALTSGDWLTAAYLAGPLFERLLRTIAELAEIPTRYTDQRSKRPRRMYRAVEELLRDLPLEPGLREYAKYVLSHPGLNLRNKAGHGLISAEQAHEIVGAHIVYLLAALAFATLEPAAS